MDRPALNSKPYVIFDPLVKVLHERHGFDLPTANQQIGSLEFERRLVPAAQDQHTVCGRWIHGWLTASVLSYAYQQLLVWLYWPKPFEHSLLPRIVWLQSPVAGVSPYCVAAVVDGCVAARFVVVVAVDVSFAVAGEGHHHQHHHQLSLPSFFVC